MRIFCLAICLLCMAAPTFAASGPVRMSSAVGPVDAGIVPLLAQKYEEKTGIPVIYEKAGTGAALKKAESGGYDLVLADARALEDAFLAAGYGLDRRDVMFNDYLILGPREDPAGIKGLKDAAEAFEKLVADQAPFVTRGDRSGIHMKEMEIWEKTGIRPRSPWYEVFPDGKKGNRAATLYADSRKSYVLADRATHLTLKKSLSIVPLVEGDELLRNNFAVIAVNPATIPSVNAAGAKAFMDWLVSDEAQGIIQAFGVDVYGEPLFFPGAQK